MAIIPVSEGCARHERGVPHNIHRLGVHADDDALERQGHATRILHHRDPISQGKVLVLQAIHGMGRLEHRLARDALDDRLLETARLLVCSEVVRENLNFLDGGLNE